MLAPLSSGWSTGPPLPLDRNFFGNTVAADAVCYDEVRLEYNGLLIRCDGIQGGGHVKMQGECHSKGRDVSSAASNQLMPRMVRN